MERLHGGRGLYGMSPVTALLTVYGEIVARFSGSRHFILNQMMSRRVLRRIPGVESVLGNLGAIYPLEFDWRGTASLQERARRLQSTIIADLGRTDWSGVDVLEALNARHHSQGSAACPFVVSSGLAGGPQEEFGYSKLATPQVLLDHQFFELRGGRVEIVWDVVEAAFPAGFIDALCDAHEALIRRLAEDPEAWAATTTLVAPRSPAPPMKPCPTRPLHVGCLSDGLKVGAAVAPNHPAVVCGGDALSYGELAAAAESFAKMLCAHGVRPGDRVAIVLPKGVAQMVAVYATLLAGAAYVPIDPASPPRRIDQLVNDIGAAAIVAAEAIEHPSVPVLRVGDDAASSTSAASARTHLPADLDPSALAYVIYTSGSTGQPKGVALDHRGPINTILDVNDAFGIVAEDVIFGVSSLSFDLSVYDIFGSAMAGATLVLPDPVDHSPHAWLATMVERQVTVWNSAPPLMQLLVDVARAERVELPALRIVMLSGDWIPVSLPEDIKAIAPNAKVISLGGATEASIWSIWYPIDAVDPRWRSIPYGRPMANQPWYVLDEQGNETPMWTTGQLHIGGVGLAQGYWGDPEKTAAAFVTHPATGERIYRTGDLGRLLPDGNIELIGRIDAQCKIQGHRVEPGEVEYVLAADPRVKDAAVVVAGEAKQKQLHAFVVLHGCASDGESIRAGLVDRLPSYMIPGRITVVASLPVTSNGKLDRGALLALTETTADVGAKYVAPRTELERTIVEIWKDVLGIETIGVDDDFFNLGGHSFAALRAVAALRSRTGRNVSLGGLLESRTVARLASLMTGQRAFQRSGAAARRHRAGAVHGSSGRWIGRGVSGPGARPRPRLFRTGGERAAARHAGSAGAGLCGRCPRGGGGPVYDHGMVVGRRDRAGDDRATRSCGRNGDAADRARCPRADGSAPRPRRRGDNAGLVQGGHGRRRSARRGTPPCLSGVRAHRECVPQLHATCRRCGCRSGSGSRWAGQRVCDASGYGDGRLGLVQPDPRHGDDARRRRHAPQSVQPERISPKS